MGITRIPDPIQKPRGPAGAVGSFSTSELTYQTALNVTGKGCLKQVQLMRSGGGSNTRQVYIKITVDGVVVVSAGFSSAAVTIGHPHASFIFNGNTDALSGLTVSSAVPASLLILDFKTSLKIETQVGPSSDLLATVSWYYEIE